VRQRQHPQDDPPGTEAALGAAAPGRELAWRGQVRSALDVLGEAARAEAENATQLDSLLGDITRTQPRLRNRVRGLRLHYGQLRDSIAALQDELDEPPGSVVDFTDIRQRLAWVLAGLRHQRGRESAVIYEACYDAFRSDITRDARRLAMAPQGKLDQRQERLKEVCGR
jgi:hypothetical protein